MSVVTRRSAALRTALLARRDLVDEVLNRYDAMAPRLFGSVARGDATDLSDIDLLVDLAPGAGNELLRLAGISEELSEALGVRVDVVSDSLLRPGVSRTARLDALPL